MREVLARSEWSDPGKFRLVQTVGLMPTTVGIEVPADRSPLPQMVVLTIQSWRPGHLPDVGEPPESQAFALDQRTARMLSTALVEALGEA